MADEKIKSDCEDEVVKKAMAWDTAMTGFRNGWVEQGEVNFAIAELRTACAEWRGWWKWNGR